MSFDTYKAARTDWIPEDANIISEYSDDYFAIVVYVWDYELNVVRFFPLGGNDRNWVVAHDYQKSAHMIEGLVSYAAG